MSHDARRAEELRTRRSIFRILFSMVLLAFTAFAVLVDMVVDLNAAVWIGMGGAVFFMSLAFYDHVKPEGKL